MNVVGLITEYNPFHNGHYYHIEQAKKITGADYVVVVMSGNFVQRGTPAITDKYTRTQMALSCGADLVFELPTVYATASAEYFAFGAVKLLHSLGFVSSICFGSECGDIKILEEIATILIEEPKAYKEQLTKELKNGSSFPVARQHALQSYFSSNEEFQAVIASPNNILGIEYIKALKRLHSTITPVTITRVQSNYHDTEMTHSISSASAIRNTYMKTNDIKQIEHAIPAEALKYLVQAFGVSMPITEDSLSLLLYYKLLFNDANSLVTYQDMTKELALRIKNILPQYTDYATFCEQLKTKNMTHSRISRTLLHVLLDIKTDEFADFSSHQVAYLRLLGAKKSSTFLLKKSKKEQLLPVITKVADAKDLLTKEQFQMFERDLLASALYNQLVKVKFNTTLADEYRRGIITHP